MEVKKFKDLTNEQLNLIIDVHFNHWVKFNPKMQREQTEYKFKNIYTQQNLPFGIALLDNEELIGFCVFKLENLKKYPHIFPWLSDVLILPQFRGKGYGKKLLEIGQQTLKNLGYSKIYVWTDQAPDFYKKLGFKYLQQVEKNEGGFGELFFKEI